MFYVSLLNENLCKKSSKGIKSDRILFDVFINLLRKPLDNSSNEKENNPAHVNIQK